MSKVGVPCMCVCVVGVCFEQQKNKKLVSNVTYLQLIRVQYNRKIRFVNKTENRWISLIFSHRGCSKTFWIAQQHLWTSAYFSSFSRYFFSVFFFFLILFWVCTYWTNRDQSAGRTHTHTQIQNIYVNLNLYVYGNASKLKDFSWFIIGAERVSSVSHLCRIDDER